MYKVFIDTIPVYFIKKEANIKNNFVGNSKFYKVEKSNLMVVLTNFLDFKTDSFDEVVLECENVIEIWQEFSKNYNLRIAAGGLVVNDENEILMIYRNDKWDLPKGHLDKGEVLEACSVREVEEECGISSPQIVEKIIVTYHTYSYKGTMVLKENHWFKMSYNGNENLVPQIEEGISRVEWVPKEKVDDLLNNSYPSILDVFKATDF